MDAHDLPKSTLRPRTTSLQSSTEVAQLQSQPQVTARSAVSQRCYAPRTVDPRLDSLMRKQFSAIGSTKVHAILQVQHVLQQRHVCPFTCRDILLSSHGQQPRMQGQILSLQYLQDVTAV